MSSRNQSAAVDLRRAEEVIADRQRRHQSPLSFSSPRGVLMWYARTRGALKGGTMPRTVKRVVGFNMLGRPMYDRVQVSVDGTSDVDVEDVRCALIDVGAAIERLKQAEGQRDGRGKAGRVDALLLVLIDGDPKTAAQRDGRVLLTQTQAARRLNVNQAQISRWIGWCTDALRPTFIEAGLIVERGV